MEIVRLSGALSVQPFEQAGEGGRVICVQVSPFKQIEIPVPQELAHMAAESLSMSDEDLVAKLEREARADAAKEQLIVPGQSQNGASLN